ncbi:tRNA N(3)-methylcytidine methyltransferase METTL6 isoform X2 [Bacillus rossius redtenbacheri]|uniref:tRNA N(3)-methylcytidine methyltransferase METTL6 isoform X2 n=1 Tax=Bacillus rossius redtenbacheri TaxID=93214 RepID=UPI002FDEC0C6
MDEINLSTTMANELLEGHYARKLSDQDVQKLKDQDSRLVSDYQSRKLEQEAKKNWDLFYKRNSNHFFKDRHWTRREFEELLNNSESVEPGRLCRKMFEVGCGVGNLIYPLLEEGSDMFIYACDISHSAIELLKSNPMYSDSAVKAFQCDITTDDVFDVIPTNSLDIITLIFVLSSIHPDNFEKTLRNLFKLLKPGGVFLFRDYGLYDMAQLRFKPGHKIADNFYMRQDGTRSVHGAMLPQVLLLL